MLSWRGQGQHCRFYIIIKSFDLLLLLLLLTAIGLTPGGSSTVHIWLTPGGSSTVHIWLTPDGSSTVHIWLTPGGSNTVHIWLTPGDSSTAHIWLTPGGSSTVHIYTQTVHRIQRKKHLLKKLGSAGCDPSLRVIPWHLPHNLLVRGHSNVFSSVYKSVLPTFFSLNISTQKRRTFAAVRNPQLLQATL
jgi:hypothetical protein